MGRRLTEGRSRSKKPKSGSRWEAVSGVTPDDEQCLKLGREVVRMIRHVMQAGQGETAYARRCLTFN